MKLMKLLSAVMAIILLAFSLTACVKEKVEDTRPYITVDLMVYGDKVTIKEDSDAKDALFLTPVVGSYTGYQYRYNEGETPTLMDVLKDVCENHSSGKVSYTLKVNGSLDTVSYGTKTYKETTYVNDDNYIVTVLWVWDLAGNEMSIQPQEYNVKDNDVIRIYFGEEVSNEQVETAAVEE